MQKIKGLGFFTYLLLAVFVLASVQGDRTSSYYIIHKTNLFTVLSGTSKNVFSLQNFHASDSSPDEAAFLAIEEKIEENEDDSEKRHLPVSTFSNFSRTHYFKETRNHFSISPRTSGSTLSIPLHIKNCIYLI